MFPLAYMFPLDRRLHTLCPLLGMLVPPVPIELAITNPRSHLPAFECEALLLHLNKYNVILQAEDQTAIFVSSHSHFTYVPNVMPRVNRQLDRLYSHLGEGLLGIAARD